jgi:hypothetical protein
MLILVPPVINRRLIIKPTINSQTKKENILAFILVRPVIVENPIDKTVKYQTVNGLMLYRSIANAGWGLFPTARISSPIGNRLCKTNNESLNALVKMSKKFITSPTRNIMPQNETTEKILL